MDVIADDKPMEDHAAEEKQMPLEKGGDGEEFNYSHLGGDDELIKPHDVVVSLDGECEAVGVEEGTVKASTPSKSSPMVRPKLSSMPSTLINLKDLPKDIANSLRAYDVDGDGLISLTEVVQGALQHQLSDEKVLFYRRMIIAIVCMWLLTMGAVFGVTYAAVVLSKDTSVDTSGGEAKMTTADSAYVIQTANSDFYIASDGSARIRTITSESYQATGSGEPDFTVMKTSPASANVTFSSAMPDSLLLELKTISVSSDSGASLHLSVLGFLRMPETSQVPSSVTFITHIGRILIEGTDVSYFDDSQAEIFLAAGFIVTNADGSQSPGRRLSGARRLSGVRSLFAIFNAVAALSEWYEGSAAYSNNIKPPRLPDNFVMYASRLSPCVPFPHVNGTIVPYHDFTGALPNLRGVDYCDILNVTNEFLTYAHDDELNTTVRYIEMLHTIYRVGEQYLRVEYRHPLVPNYTYVEVLDNSIAEDPVQFRYMVDFRTQGFEYAEVNGVGGPVFLGPVFYYNETEVTSQDLANEANSGDFDYLGLTTLDGEDVRIWALHLASNTVHAYWYDTVTDQTVRRISYGSLGSLNVIELVPMDEPAQFSHLFSAPVQGTTVIYTDAQAAGNISQPTYFALDAYLPFVPSAISMDRNMSESVAFDISSVNVSQVRRLDAVLSDTERVGQGLGQAWGGGETRAAGAEADAPGPAPDTTPVYVPGGCAEGWTVGKTKCYLFVPQTYTRDACTAFCQSQGALNENDNRGNEISPLFGGLCAQSQEEADFLTLHSAYSDSVAGSWLNYDRDASGVWRWGKGCARSGYEQWSKAAPVSAKAFPSWTGAYSLSHYRDASGDWNNADPSSQQHCSCETPKHSPVASCPLGWVQGPEHCYHLDPDYEKVPKKTWGECRDACADMGADMLCIRSQGEQDFLGGLRSSPRSDYYTLWVGVTGQEGGGYGWEEGCDSTYSNFAPSDSKFAHAHVAFDSAQKSAWAGTGAGHRATCACQLSASASRALSPTALALPNLPQIDINSVVSVGSSLVTFIANKALGCAANNKCDAKYLWFQMVQIPDMLSMTAVGNEKYPCKYSQSLEASNPFIIPGVEFTLTGTSEYGFCNDLSGIDYFMGIMSVSVAPVPFMEMPTPFDSIFSYQIASVGLGLTFFQPEVDCRDLTGTRVKDRRLLLPVVYAAGNTARKDKTCACLARRNFYPAMIMTFGGPDIPGFVLAALPPFYPLGGILAVTRLTTTVIMLKVPNVCEIAWSKMTYQIGVLINLGLYQYSFNVLSFEQEKTRKAGDSISGATTGAYQNYPLINGDGEIKSLRLGQFFTNVINQPFIDMADRMEEILQTFDIDWGAIQDLGGAIADAAQAYFEYKMNNGGWIKGYGEHYRQLNKIFRPAPYYQILQCLNGVQWSKPYCKDRKFGICYNWSLPEITCGKLQCVKWC